ncbi:transmembrane protein 182 [Astyanax mexicanus]|uniref:transmembrane protein 182 n=1 Tax=Astyanax mexicanus TaxID=7994 RepID=UPI0020CAB771|nr:transmembrane protein 182 [Astyanax mexicanus]
MKTGVVALVGGLLGGLGVLCFLVAFGTDYWLLASDDCGGLGQLETTLHTVSVEKQANSTEGAEVTAPGPPPLTLHHEGFFWRCLFRSDPSLHVVWAVLFTNQPRPKVCTPGYLFPLPVAVGPVPHPIYDATAVFRGFWTMLIILAIAVSVTGGFLLVCAVPFFSHKLYRAGGTFFITAACLFLVLVGLFVLWKELVDVRRYVLQERGDGCPGAHLEAHYGWSFMVAVAGIPLVLLSGLLFFCVGKHIQKHT